MHEIALDEILKPREASQYLRLKQRTLYTLAGRGIIPATKIGGQWRFRRSQLDGLFKGGQESDLSPEPASAFAAGRDESQCKADNGQLTTDH